MELDFLNTFNVASNVSGSNSALTMSLPGLANTSYLLWGYLFTTRGAAVVGDLSLEVKDGGTIIWRDTLGTGAVRGTRLMQSFFPPLKSTIGNAVSINAPAGGNGVFITISAWFCKAT